MSKTLADFDFFDPEVIESPYQFYQALRSQAPVYQLPGTNIFMLSRWEDIRRAAKDTATFSNDFTRNPAPRRRISMPEVSSRWIPC
jgi:cytochrome P450